MSFLADLIAQSVLRCPCGGALVADGERVRCASCNRAFAFANGALDLYGAYVEAPRSPPDAAFVLAVARALKLPEDADTLARTAEAVALTQLVSGDIAHTAEIAELADRLGLAPSPGVAPAQAIAKTDANPRIEWGVHFLENEMPLGASLLRSVRIRNAGMGSVASSGANAMHIACRWRDARGHVAANNAKRSLLPVPLLPGRELTVITRLATPSNPGDYTLEHHLAGADGRAIDPPAPPIAVRVARDAQAGLALAETGKAYDYGGDHHVAAVMIFERIRDQWPATRLCVLEVGGGIHPSMAGLAPYGHSVLALDVSFPQSQLGAIYHEKVTATGERMGFVACDALEPPVADGAFDCAAVFAAVHHFARPDLLLAALARRVRPGGFIAVMCEPCAPDPEGVMYLRDLAKGINEQAWSPAEWGVIFERAGLVISQGQIDSGSLKAILVHAEPGSDPGFQPAKLGV